MSDYARILPQKNFKVKFKGKIFTPFLQKYVIIAKIQKKEI